MPALEYDFYVEQGATWTQPLIIMENGLPKDLTGCTLRGQIRAKASYGIGVLVAELTFNVTDAQAGEVSIEKTDIETAAIHVAGNNYAVKTIYVYDVELVEVDGTVKRILNGKIHVSPEVTVETVP